MKIKKLILLIPIIFLANIIHAQITGVGHTGSFQTSYSNAFIGEGGNNDEVFVFCNTAPSLSISNSGGCDIMWFIYDGLSFVELGNTSATISNLANGLYMVRKNCSGNIECYRAWVWRTDIIVSVNELEPTCDPFTVNGNIGINNGSITINDPPGEDFYIDEDTYIQVCFWAVHTYVSDIGFYLKSPGNQAAEPGNNGVVQLCPAASDWGPNAAQGSWTGIPWPVLGCRDASDENTVCNSGDNVNGFCFTTHNSYGGNVVPAGDPAHTPCVCDLSTPLTGTFGSVGPWSPIYGSRAAEAGWAVQIYDCEGADVGRLTRATITFTGETDCGTATFYYDSGTISSSINDNSCSASSASLFVVPPRDPAGSYTVNTIINNVEWTSIPPGYSGNQQNLQVNPIPEENTIFSFAATSRVEGTDITCTHWGSTEFISMPVDATITPVAPLCLDSSPVQLQTEDGGGTWTVNGNIPGNIIRNGYFYPSEAGVGIHTLTYTIDDVCDDEDEIYVEVYDNIFITNFLDTVCNLNNTYNVTFNVINSQGNPTPFYYDIGSGRVLENSGIFHEEFTSGTPYTITVTDLNGCDEYVFSGLWDCGCRTYAGNFTDFTLLTLCQNETTEDLAIHDDEFVNDGDDMLLFIIHDGSGNRPPTILAQNTVPVFSINDITSTQREYGRIYYISAIAGNQVGANQIDLTDECLSVSQGKPVLWLQNPVASISTRNQAVCGKSVSLAANAPSTGMTGFWRTRNGEYFVPTGGSTNNDHEINVIVSSYGEVDFIWTIQNNMCYGSDTVTITFSEPPVAYAGENQTVCGTIATLNAIPSVSGSTGSWSGNGRFSSENSPTTDVEVSSSGSQVYVWREVVGNCSSQAMVNVTFIGIPTPVILQPYDNACGETYNLSVHTSATTGRWRAYENGAEIYPMFNPSGANLPNTQVTISSYTGLSREIEFVWEETNSSHGIVCTNSATAVITFMKIPIAQILGDDVINVCGNCVELSANTDATVINDFESSWLLKSGVNGTWDPDITSPTTTFCANQAGLFGDTGYARLDFVWVLKNVSGDYECSSSAPITVNMYQKPVANAGLDATICGNEYTLGAVFNIPESENYTPWGSWTAVQENPGDIANIQQSTTDHSINDTVNVHVAPGGIWQFVFTERNGNAAIGDCQSRDTVRVEFVNYPSVYVGEDRNICGNKDTLRAQDGNATGGFWSSSPNPAGLDADERITEVIGNYNTPYRFIWYAHNNSTSGIEPAAVCPSSDTVYITFWEKPSAAITTPAEDADQCGKTNICGVLKADPPGSGITGYWKGATDVVLDWEHSPSDVCIYSVPFFRPYEFMWIEYVSSMPQNFCADTARFTITFHEMPNANAGNDTLFCGSRGTLRANPSVGTGLWKSDRDTDDISFGNETNATTTIDCDVHFGTYDILWLERNSICTDTAKIKVTFQKLPSAEVSVIDPKCSKWPAVITANETELTNYRWNLDGGVIDSSRYNTNGGE
ncbi:MAG: hypothetical protein LBQ22_04830, partial [Bacteroidales bacterium]|nr:hypothetical protein [Bacteroidales bacterium]